MVIRRDREGKCRLISEDKTSTVIKVCFCTTADVRQLYLHTQNDFTEDVL